MPEPVPTFDPRGLLAALDRHRVAYIIVGAFARVVQGADEITRSIDIVPRPARRTSGASMRPLPSSAPAGPMEANLRSGSEALDPRRAHHQARGAEDHPRAYRHPRLRGPPPRRHAGAHRPRASPCRRLRR